MSKKRFVNAVTYILAFFIVFFLSAVFFSQVVLKSESVSIPDLEGMTPADARALLKKKDLSLSQKGSESNDQWEKGKIIRQSPAAGSKMQVTRVVQVFVSSGSQNVLVPALEGKSLESAIPLLKEAGLHRGDVSRIHTPVAAGRILAQRPAAADQVARNSAVGFLISQGDWEERYVMPDLIGRNAEAVIARLQSLDFKIGDIRYTYYAGHDRGVIIGQFPPSGYRIQQRNMITLEVSR